MNTWEYKQLSSHWIGALDKRGNQVPSCDWTAAYNEHVGVQASSSEGHPPGLPRDSPAQRQEPTWSALIQGNWRASPSYGHLCSFLHLGRPQLQQERQWTVRMVAAEWTSHSGAHSSERRNYS